MRTTSSLSRTSGINFRSYIHRKPIPDDSTLTGFLAGFSHLDHALAAVFPREQTDQRLRRIFKAVDDVFLDFQPAGSDPGLQIAQRLVALVHEVHHDKT